MKESDITSEIIVKAKEIVKYWRMEIYEGCWVVNQSKTWREVSSIKKEAVIRDEGAVLIYTKSQIRNYELAVPIPSISDCLEKLRELEVGVALQDHLFLMYAVGTWDSETSKFKPTADASTPLEALLSALLEVLTK